MHYFAVYADFHIPAFTFSLSNPRYLVPWKLSFPVSPSEEKHPVFPCLSRTVPSCPLSPPGMSHNNWRTVEWNPCARGHVPGIGMPMMAHWYALQLPMRARSARRLVILIPLSNPLYCHYLQHPNYSTNIREKLPQNHASPKTNP